VAALPLLLVAVDRQRGVQRPDALERAAADGHVGAPDELGVAVLGAEVEERHGRPLAAAGAEGDALQPHVDRSAEDVGLGVVARGAEQGGEPAVRRVDVVVHEHDQLGAGGLDAGVARGVRPARLGWAR